MIRIPELGKPE